MAGRRYVQSGPPARAKTLDEAAKHASGRHQTQERETLQGSRIWDGMDSNTRPALRAATHCVAYILARMVSRAHRNISWSKITWTAWRDDPRGASDSAPAKHKKRRLDAPMEGEVVRAESVRRVLHLLNHRSTALDYHCACMEGVPSKGESLLQDASSYLRLVTLGRYHYVVRSVEKEDPRWHSVMKAKESTTCVFARSVLLCLWVFTRSSALVGLLDQWLRGGKAFATESDIHEFAREASAACPSWKTELHRRSRDYALNTCHLERNSEKPQLWWARGVSCIMNSFPEYNEAPCSVAERWSEIANCGGFGLQHLIWASQCLGFLRYETVEELTWSRVKKYVSKRNTFRLAEKFLAEWGEEEGTAPPEVVTGMHRFKSPLGIPVTPKVDDVGGFMLAVHREFRMAVLELKGYTFAVTTVGDVSRTQTISLDDVAEEVTAFLCFCTNNCMHMKMFDDLEGRCFPRRAPTAEMW